MKRLMMFLVALLSIAQAYSQEKADTTIINYSGPDTLHYNKVYYFGGTGLAFPIGKTKESLSPQAFSGSIGLDIALRNPRYFVIPTLFTMAFRYNQLIDDPNYNQILENGQASIYALSLAGGIRKQVNRLNTYAYAGPAFALDVESRVNSIGNSRSRMEKIYSFSPAVKIGVGSDYKFRGFYLGLEFDYMHHFRNIQGNPVNVLTVMVGLKSDITSFSDRMVQVIKPKE
ncbi:hypothetical protein M8998_02465 [Sphingobacterium sp. lm-10]|uniref:hypothetical protein n=1 Tax=Sphingobacterium sp. lm-10 TaxID=2944904 RepID=UPI0020216DAB|nr:hypothetical protein [Sphingobacterium sp. lm-10]MCL7986797.1 hypothetical protein [Sphingobacterium sp. lm-10]